MRNKKPACLFAIILSCILLLLSACSSPAASEKEKLSRTIIKRCSNVWRFVAEQKMIPDNLEPTDCSWLYAEYEDRTIVTEIKEGEGKYYTWFPDSGYAVCIGKNVFLCDDYGNVIGFYSDNDNAKLFVETGSKKKYDTPSSKDEALYILSDSVSKMMVDSSFKLTMLSFMWRANFFRSFDELDLSKEEENPDLLWFYQLNSDQVKQIGQQ